MKDRETWHAAGYEAAKSQTQLSKSTPTKLSGAARIQEGRLLFSLPEPQAQNHGRILL